MKCPVCQTSVSTNKARSIPQMRRFFGVLRAMFHHWPHEGFQPESEEHLRAYVLCKSGHADVTSIDVPDRATDALVVTIQAALKAAGSYAFVQPDGDTIKIFKPKSIAFARLSHSEFSALNTRVEEVYRVETKLDPDEVLVEHERAA